MLELGKTYCMNCLDGMKLLDDCSVDLTVTSPPYDDLRAYNGYKFNFETFKEIAKELYRVTKVGGVVVWVVGDKTHKGSETGTSFKQALYFKEIGFNLHDTMIYAKENWTPLTHNRYEQQFEFMFVFSKGNPKTFNPLTMPTLHGGKKITRSQNNNGEGKAVRDRKYSRVTPTEKRKPNIWIYKVGTNCSTKDTVAMKHPAIFPEQLVSDHIISWSNENDIVMDIFSGSGTTHKMSLLNNRKYIGFEMSQEYIDIENERLIAIK